MHMLQSPGSVVRPTRKQIEVELESHKTMPAGVSRIFKRLRGMGIVIRYNIVYQIIKEDRVVTSLATKSRIRKWMCYERRYSNAMWHVNWHDMKDPRLKGLKTVAYLDDTSRCVTGFGLYGEATAHNGGAVLRMAIERFGRPATILSDNGEHFVTMRNSPPEKTWRPTAFESELLEQGIYLINSRSDHPQTNGKLKRFFQTLEKEVVHHDGIQEYVDYYNERRLH